VCLPWLSSFDAFYADMFPSYVAGMTLERSDVNADYQASNCRWASKLEQQANKRTTKRLVYQGEDTHLAALCRTTGLSRCAISTRLALGMDAEQAVAAAIASPYKKNRKRRTYTT